MVFPAPDGPTKAMVSPRSHPKRDIAHGGRRGRLVLKADALECERPQVVHRRGVGGLRLLRDRQNLLVDVERRFRLLIDVDDVPQLLQRPEDEERVDEEREELPDRDRARVNQVEHQEHDARSKEVDGRALDEAETPQVAHLLQLELQDLSRRAVQPIDLLLPEAEALHQLDVPQRLGRRPGKRRGLGDDDFLNRLDPCGSARSSAAQARGTVRK